MDQCAQVPARITHQHAIVRNENAERFLPEMIGQIRDVSSNAVISDCRFSRPLQGKNLQMKTMALKLQDLIADESFREPWKHFHDVANLRHTGGRFSAGPSWLAFNGRHLWRAQVHGLCNRWSG